MLCLLSFFFFITRNEMAIQVKLPYTIFSAHIKVQVIHSSQWKREFKNSSKKIHKPELTHHHLYASWRIASLKRNKQSLCRQPPSLPFLVVNILKANIMKLLMPQNNHQYVSYLTKKRGIASYLSANIGYNHQFEFWECKICIIPFSFFFSPIFLFINRHCSILFICLNTC